MGSRSGDRNATKLPEALLAIGAEQALDRVLERVVEQAQALTGARYGALGILDERRLGLRRFLTSGIDGDARRRIGEPPRGRGILGLLIVEPRPLRISNIERHPRSYGFPIGHPPMTSFLGVPIAVDGEPWGNLYLTDKRGCAEFSDDDEWTSTVLAQAAGQAIERAIHTDQAAARRKLLEQRAAGLDAAIAVLEASGADERTQLELLVKRAWALAGAGQVLLLLRDGDELLVGGATGACRPVVGTSLPLAHAATEFDRPDRIPSRLVELSGLSQAWRRTGLGDPEPVRLTAIAFGGRCVGLIATTDGADADRSGAAAPEHALRVFAAAIAGTLARLRQPDADATGGGPAECADEPSSAVSGRSADGRARS